MNYLAGYTIKPFRITALGIVIFTDGTNDAISPNQLQCEAYGYTYDPATATCRSFTPNANFQRNLNNIDNKINGSQNTIRTGGKNIHINGTNNTAEGLNNNCFISGNGNTIASGIKNATVVGFNGIARTDGVFVIGAGTDISSTTIFFSGETTTSSTKQMFLNNTISATNTAIPRNSASLLSYTVDVTGYRTGGASGSGAIADRIFFKVQGILKANTPLESTTIIADTGITTGWSAATTVIGSDWGVSIRGATGMTIFWSAVMNVNEMKIT
tara:strand:+ start:1638 stop:2450 length:813 start_codon:yes stop_codon:yes gene_type:complete